MNKVIGTILVVTNVANISHAVVSGDKGLMVLYMIFMTLGLMFLGIYDNVE